jgi:hypothetical protein
MRSVGTWDNYLFLHESGLDPARPQSGVMLGNDDFPSVGTAGFAHVTLYAGTTYLLVTTGFQNQDSGKYLLEITGPGRPQADSALENWRFTWFGNKEDTGEMANASDYDRDGIANLLEFAFGLNPTRASSGLLPRMQRVGSNYAVTFTQPDGVSGITYGAEWSTTMLPASWIAIPDTGPPPQHIFTIPAGGAPAMFMRLKVNVP